MNKLDEIRQAWAEINLDNLAYNINQVRKHIKKDTLIMAVMKANGYGHGSKEIAKVFLENGASRLGVAILDEAIELRRANIQEPLMILGPTPRVQYEKIIENNLIQTIYSYDDAKILSDKALELDKTATIHIKIDSGMGRIGFLPNEKSIEEIINIWELPNLYLEGIYTHFSNADERDKSNVRGQFKKYIELVNILEEKGVNIKIKHVSNSASIIDLPEYNLDMVRPGIMLYGLYPSNEVNKETIRIKPVMTLKAKISNLKIVDKGVGISYGQIFKTESPSKIATLPIGYADGYTRILTGKAEVFIDGQRAKVVGKICMDQCMIDVTHIENVNIGDEIVIFGYGKEDYPSVDEIGEQIGIINYEVVCTLGRRVPRVYISNGEIISVENYLLD